MHEDATVTRLQREISFLKDVLQLKNKGTVNDMSNKVIRLQEENDRLKQIVKGLPKSELN